MLADDIEDEWPPHRGKADTPAGMHELRRLYDLLALTTTCAIGSLGKEGSPTVDAFDRFTMHDETVRTIVSRIHEILTWRISSGFTPEGNNESSRDD